MSNLGGKKSGGAKKWVLSILGVLVVIFVAVGIWAGPTIHDLLPFLVPPAEKKVGWTPGTEINLKALYTGMMLQHDSDGQFPDSATWMDQIIKRVRNETLKAGAEKEKFVDPAAGGKPGEYGFAMNDAAAAKYKDDIKDKAMPLIFESSDTQWNAHGDPTKIGRKHGIGISVDGKIVRL